MAHDIFVYTNTVLSYVLNTLLIYLIVYHTKCNIGNYRYIMIIFAVFEMIYTTVDLFAHPEFILNDHCFLCVFNGSFWKWLNREAQMYAIAAFCGLFGQSLVLLGCHFLYRFIALCRRDYIFIFERKWYILLMISIQTSIMLVWVTVCVVFLQVTEEKDALANDYTLHKYNWSLTDRGYVGPLYKQAGVWHLKDFCGMAILTLILSMCTSAIVVCTYFIVKSLRSTQMSDKTRSMQKRLFFVLLLQTAVPLLTAHTPCAYIFLGAAFGIVDQHLEHVVAMVITVYPVFDPIIMIYFIGDYRNALMKLLRLRVNRTAYTVPSTFLHSSNSGTTATDTGKSLRSLSAPV